MPPSKRRVNVYIESDHWLLIQALRRRSGAPISEIVRRAISEYATKNLSRQEIQDAQKEAGKPKTKKQQRDPH
jgi:hypothetical protein